MSVYGKLRKIKLRVTPRRVAVQHLDWAENVGRTKEPCPLPGLMKQMQTEIGLSIAFLLDQHKLIAEQEVLFLVELYVRAFTELIGNGSASLHLMSFMEAYCVPLPFSCPELYKRLVEHCNALSVSLAAIEQIQSDYLGKPIMSGELTDFLIEIQTYLSSLSLRLVGPPAVLGEGESGISERFLEAHEVAAQARGKVRDLVALARKTACIDCCNRAAPFLLHPFLAFMKHADNFKLCCLAVDKAKQELERTAKAGGNRSPTSGVRGRGKAVHRKRKQTD